MDSERRLSLFADASKRLADASDVDAALTDAASLLVPEFADWVAFDVVQADGTVRTLSSDVAGGAASPDAAEPPERGWPAAVQALLRSATPVVCSDLREPDRSAAGDDRRDYREMLRRLGFAAAIGAPMVARQRVAGALTCAVRDAPRLRGVGDEALVTGLAAVAALAVESGWQRREAQEARRLRDEVLSSVSHDLRTPLTTIRGVVQLLTRRVAQDTPLGSDQVSERLELIERAAGQLAALIDEIVDFARLEEGRALELNRRSVDLVQIVQRVAAAQQDETDEERVRIATPLKELTGWWDAGRLKRVVAKLVANALRHSPPGQDVTVFLDRHDAQDGLPQAVVVVRDRGTGLAPADVEAIFDRGRRATETRTRRGRLDLAGCRQIAELLGGSLTVESPPGEGAAFRLLLPIDEPRG